MSRAGAELNVTREGREQNPPGGAFTAFESQTRGLWRRRDFCQGASEEMSTRATEDASAAPEQRERAVKVTLHPRLPNGAFQKVALLNHLCRLTGSSANCQTGWGEGGGGAVKLIIGICLEGDCVYGSKNDVPFMPEWSLRCV